MLLAAVHGGASAQGDAKRGAYLATAAGCVGCHTEAKKDAPPCSSMEILSPSLSILTSPFI